MPPQSKKRKSSLSSLSNPFDNGPPSPASSSASSSPAAAGSSTSTGGAPTHARAGSVAPSTSSAGGHPAIGGGVGELIGTGTGPGDVNEPGISLSESRRRARVLRNRESAQRSRDAKKNHQQELETRVAELEAELAVVRGGSSSTGASSSSAPPTTTAATVNNTRSSITPPSSSSSQAPIVTAASSPPPDVNLTQRLVLERDNAELLARVGRLEELVRGLVRLMGQAPAVAGSVVDPLSMGGLVNLHQDPSTTVDPPLSASTGDGGGFGSFSPEEFAFAEQLVANGAFHTSPAPTAEYAFPPSPTESASPSSRMEGLESSAAVPAGDFKFAVRPFAASSTSDATLGCPSTADAFATPLFDLAPLPSPAPPLEHGPRPLSPDFAEYLNPFATADDEDDALANFQFVSDPLAGSASLDGRELSPTMSDVSFGSISSSSTVGAVGHHLHSSAKPMESGSSSSNGNDSLKVGHTGVGQQTGASPSARWFSLPQQRVPSPVLLPSSTPTPSSMLTSPSSSTIRTTTALPPPARPLPAMLRRTSSRPGSPMQISPPASPRTVPSFTLSTAPASPRRPGTLLLRTSSTASLPPPPSATLTTTTTTTATGDKQPTASTSAAGMDCGRPSRSALGRGSRHLQRVFSGKAAGGSSTASTSTSSGSSSSAWPSSSASNPHQTTSSATRSSPRPAFPTLGRTTSSSALRPPKRPISPLNLGALGLNCLNDLMAQHQTSSGSSIGLSMDGAASGSGSGSSSHGPSTGPPSGPTEKLHLVKQEFRDLGMGGMGSPRSVGCC